MNSKMWREFQYFAMMRQKMNYYNCTWEEAQGFIPPEWAIYYDRHGVMHPAEARTLRKREEFIR